MRVWLLPREEKRATPSTLPENLPPVRSRSATRQPPPRFTPPDPLDSLPQVKDARPPNNQAPSADLPIPRQMTTTPPAPQTEVDYTQSLPEIRPTRRARKDFGQQPVEEFQRLPSLPTYAPLTRQQRTGFKGRMKGAWNALQNAGSAGAGGQASVGALIGGLINPERANQVRWHRTEELPALARRQAAEESIARRQKIRNETEEAETNKEKADHLFYATDATREETVQKLKAAALRAGEERKATASEKEKDRGSTEKVATIQAETSRQNNIRTNTTSTANNIRTNTTKIQTNQNKEGADPTDEEVDREIQDAQKTPYPYRSREEAVAALKQRNKEAGKLKAEKQASRWGGSWKNVPPGR